MATNFEKGKRYESRRRWYWNTRSDVLDVHSDTYGPTDLAVVFKEYVDREQKVLLVQVKTNGYLKPAEREKLKEFLEQKPDVVGLRVEYKRELDGGDGNGNTTYTDLEAPKDIDRHEKKIKDR